MYEIEVYNKISEAERPNWHLFIDAIYKAEKLLFDAEFELSKVLRDECWMNLSYYKWAIKEGSALKAALLDPNS